jgi:hypothetical protein
LGGCSENITTKDTQKDIGINIGAVEPSKIPENTPSMKLSQELTSICEEMDQNQITMLKPYQAKTSVLYQRLFECIECHWPAKEFVEQVKVGGEYTSEYYTYTFDQYKESDGESEHIEYFSAPYSIAPLDEYYKVTAFCRNSDNDKIIDVIFEDGFDSECYAPTVKLDFSEENNIKLIVDADEYLYIGVEVTQFINDNVFLGRYQDQNGIYYEFTDDCEAIWGERRFLYEPFVCTLAFDFNAIEKLDNGEGGGELFGVKYEDGKLYLYKLIYSEYDNPVMSEKPFAVLTRIGETSEK